MADLLILIVPNNSGLIRFLERTRDGLLSSISKCLLRLVSRRMLAYTSHPKHHGSQEYNDLVSHTTGFRIKKGAIPNPLCLWVTLPRLLLSNTRCHMTHRGHKGSLGCHDDAARDAERKGRGGQREPEKQRYAKEACVSEWVLRL